MKAVLLALVLCLVVVQAKLLISVDDAPGSHVKYTITNQGLQPVTILNYGTPFEANGTLFYPVVSISEPLGNVLPYAGAVARRVHPERAVDAHLIIPAQSSLSKLIDLEEIFDIENPGVYSIVAKKPGMNPSLLDAEVDEPLNKFLRASRVQYASFANTYENCDSTEQSQVASAESTAQSQALRARNCMNDKTCNNEVGIWFGNKTTYGSSNYVYDQGVFTNIYSTLNGEGIHAYCNPVGCGPNVYAYVYPNDPKMLVYLCGAFWSQPTERANTIVHEESHFTVIGDPGTQDYAYGKVACKNLANTNAYQATHNADNVCYFSADV